MNFPLSQHEKAVAAVPAPSSMRGLLRRSIDLRGLYRCAAVGSEPGLRMVLEENLHTLDLLVSELLEHCDLAQVSGVHGSWRGSLRRHMTDWLARSASHRDLAWIRVLAHHETALLEAFESAITSLPSPQALLLRRQLPRLNGIHMDIHHLVGSAPR